MTRPWSRRLGGFALGLSLSTSGASAADWRLEIDFPHLMQWIDHDSFVVVGGLMSVQKQTWMQEAGAWAWSQVTYECATGAVTEHALLFLKEDHEGAQWRAPDRRTREIYATGALENSTQTQAAREAWKLLCAEMR